MSNDGFRQAVSSVHFVVIEWVFRYVMCGTDRDKNVASLRHVASGTVGPAGFIPTPLGCKGLHCKGLCYT